MVVRRSPSGRSSSGDGDGARLRSFPPGTVVDTPRRRRRRYNDIELIILCSLMILVVKLGTNNIVVLPKMFQQNLILSILLVLISSSSTIRSMVGGIILRSLVLCVINGSIVPTVLVLLKYRLRRIQRSIVRG